MSNVATMYPPQLPGPGSSSSSGNQQKHLQQMTVQPFVPTQPLRRATYIHVSDLISAYNIDHTKLENELDRVKTERRDSTTTTTSSGAGSKGQQLGGGGGVGIATGGFGPSNSNSGGGGGGGRHDSNVSTTGSTGGGSQSSTTIVSGIPTELEARDPQKRLQPPRGGHNMVVLVGKLKVVVDKYRVDGSRVRLAEVEVGDETGTVSLRARDEQIDIIQAVALNDTGSIVLRNCTIELYQGKHIRLAVTKWGKLCQYPDSVPSTPPSPSKMNRDRNFSLIDLSLVASEMTTFSSPLQTLTDVNMVQQQQQQPHHTMSYHRQRSPSGTDSENQMSQHQQQQQLQQRMKGRKQPGRGGKPNNMKNSPMMKNNPGSHYQGIDSISSSRGTGAGGGGHGGGSGPRYNQHPIPPVLTSSVHPSLYGTGYAQQHSAVPSPVLHHTPQPSQHYSYPPRQSGTTTMPGVHHHQQQPPHHQQQYHQQQHHQHQRQQQHHHHQQQQHHHQQQHHQQQQQMMYQHQYAMQQRDRQHQMYSTDSTSRNKQVMPPHLHPNSNNPMYERLTNVGGIGGGGGGGPRYGPSGGVGTGPAYLPQQHRPLRQPHHQQQQHHALYHQQPQQQQQQQQQQAQEQLLLVPISQELSTQNELNIPGSPGKMNPKASTFDPTEKK